MANMKPNKSHEVPREAPDLVEAAKNLASVLAGDVENYELQECQLMFRLAKRLQGIPGALDVKIMRMKPAVSAYAEFSRRKG